MTIAEADSLKRGAHPRHSRQHDLNAGQDARGDVRGPASSPANGNRDSAPDRPRAAPRRAGTLSPGGSRRRNGDTMIRWGPGSGGKRGSGIGPQPMQVLRRPRRRPAPELEDRFASSLVVPGADSKDRVGRAFFPIYMRSMDIDWWLCAAAGVVFLALSVILPWLAKRSAQSRARRDPADGCRRRPLSRQGQWAAGLVGAAAAMTALLGSGIVVLYHLPGHAGAVVQDRQGVAAAEPKERFDPGDGRVQHAAPP